MRIYVNTHIEPAPSTENKIKIKRENRKECMLCKVGGKIYSVKVALRYVEVNA